MADQVTRAQLVSAIDGYAKAHAAASWERDQGWDYAQIAKAQRDEIAHREFLDAQLNSLFPETAPIIP